jgi:hypothetical protein
MYVAMSAMPKWFDWIRWSYAIGSDDRYELRWYERRAYVMGLRDAARIAERNAWFQATGESGAGKTLGFADLRRAIAEIHHRALSIARGA